MQSPLHSPMAFWMLVVILVVALAVLLRASLRSQAEESVSARSPTERFWGLLPSLIVVALAIPALGVVVKKWSQDEPEVTVQLTGSRWQWRYVYVSGHDNADRQEEGAGTRMDEQHPLVLPAGRTVRLLVTSDDVIHTWSVPALHSRIDAIPGFTQDNRLVIPADALGAYRGEPSLQCGKDNPSMIPLVEVRPSDQFDAWRAQ